MNIEKMFFDTVTELKEAGLDWNPKPLQSASGPTAIIEGKEQILLCANNYLGLSNRMELKKAAIEATEKYGAGSGSVRAIAGTMELHKELEKKIAHYKETDAALYYQSGFTVNSGLLPAVLTKGWIVISDELNHGSIIDGVRLSKADKMIFPHRNMEELRKQLQKAQKQNPIGILIATDGVFSMDGDMAPLDKIQELATEFDANIFVDDAHGDGVLGENGKGITSYFKLHGKIDIEMGTFSKAFGTVGGYVCGSEALCEFASNKSRTWLLTGSHPPGVVAASMAALDLIESDHSIVKKLWENREYFVKELQAKGFDTGETQTPIVPVMLGDSKVAQTFSKELYKNGVYALPIVFPMVAKEKARIRTQLSAGHSREHLDQALEAIEKVGKELKVI